MRAVTGGRTVSVRLSLRHQHLVSSADQRSYATDCASHCETGKCSDGLLGNGQCAATLLTNSTTGTSAIVNAAPFALAELSTSFLLPGCSCLNGQCTDSTSSSSACTCSPGWASPSLTASRPTYASVTDHLQCSICASGFTLLGGECVACGPYATACSSDRTATACVTGSEVELGSCVSTNGPSGKGSSCSGANYWDARSSSCSPCAPHPSALTLLEPILTSSSSPADARRPAVASASARRALNVSTARPARACLTATASMSTRPKTLATRRAPASAPRKASG